MNTVYLKIWIKESIYKKKYLVDAFFYEESYSELKVTIYLLKHTVYPKSVDI